MEKHYLLGCNKCKESISLGKLTEPDAEKKDKVWKFLKKHILHDLKVLGDNSSQVKDMINTSEEEWDYWETDFNQFF